MRHPSTKPRPVPQAFLHAPAPCPASLTDRRTCPARSYVQGAGLSHLQGGRHVSPQEFHRLLRAQEEISARRHRDHVDANAGEKEVGGRKSMARELNASADAADGDSDSEGKGGSQVEEEQRRGFGYKADARVEKSMVEENEEKEAVLLDVRNVYETSIGHFRCPSLAHFFCIILLV